MLRVIVLMIMATAAPGSAPAPKAHHLTFADITNAAGVAGPHHYGGHGIGWADVTNDGKPDGYITMNFKPIHMAELFYRNIDGTRFREEASDRGIASFDAGSHGVVWADLDNDGDYDLVNGSYERNHVFENDGTGHFIDRTKDVGILDVSRGTRGIVAFDFDNDGDLDVFCNNWAADNEANEFYRNDGNLRLTPIDNGLGCVVGVQGVTEGDYDNDGDMDLLLCRGFGNDGPLTLMCNTSGTFSPVVAAGFDATANRQDGATWVDVNNDGWLDVHVMNGNVAGIGRAWLFINDKNGRTFTAKPVPVGPGFMAGFEDLDNDGDWDMVYAGDNKTYLNDGASSFRPTASFPIQPGKDPRSVAFADIDNDGDMDFLYTHKRGFNRLIRNDLSRSGNWIKVKIVSPTGQAGAFGAKVTTYESGFLGEPAKRISFREARSQEGYLAQNEPVLHFGIADRSGVDVEVRFLDGTVLRRTRVGANRLVVLGPCSTSSSISQPHRR